MSLFNEYFDGIYVLSLQRLEERRRSIERQMRELRIEFEFVEGIDASAVEVSAIADEFHRRGKSLQHPYVLAWEYPDLPALRRQMAANGIGPGQVLTPGNLCAGAGHLRVIDRILASNVRRALVLEDDARFADDAGDILAAIVADLESATLQGRWDLVIMGSTQPLADVVPWRCEPDAKPWHSIRPPRPPESPDGRRSIRAAGGGLLRHVFHAFEEWGGAHCYALSSNCAAFLAENRYMVNPDGMLARLFLDARASHECFVSHPFIAYQYGAPSWIDKANAAVLGYDRRAIAGHPG